MGWLIALGYALCAAVYARVAYSIKVRQYYSAKVANLQHERTWLSAVQIRHEQRLAMRKAKEDGAFWTIFSAFWPIGLVALLVSRPTPIEREVQEQQRKDEELEELRKIAEREGWKL